MRRACHAVLLALACAGAHARDAAAGRAKSQVCMVCHGPVGVSTTPDAPHLAAQPAIYVAAQLRAYRAGTRKHEVMGVIARTLTDDDVATVRDKCVAAVTKLGASLRTA